MKRFYFQFSFVLLFLSSFYCHAQQPTFIGTTYNGGSNGVGAIFSNDALAANPKNLYSFGGEDSNPGANPRYSELLQATNGKL